MRAELRANGQGHGYARYYRRIKVIGRETAYPLAGQASSEFHQSDIVTTQQHVLSASLCGFPAKLTF